LSYTSGTTLANLPGGETVAPLMYTRFGGSCDSDNTTRVADVRAEWGWNFLMDEDYHFGLYIAGAAPTGRGCGSDCDGLLWGAKVGNGNHWELGGGLTAHYTLWRAEDCEQQFDFFLDATVTHMFKHSELRTFDLLNSPLSRYIIAEKLTTAASGLTVASTAAKYQFGAAYAPVANFTTYNVDVSIGAQADVMAKFVYTCRGFSWAIGYDFWGQSCPNVSFDCDCPIAFPENTWALRGNAEVYGFNSASVAVPIPATSTNCATVFNVGSSSCNAFGANSNNAGVDNAGTPVLLGSDTLTTASPTVGIYGSNPPVFITEDDVDWNSGLSRGMTNTIFTELNYSWIDCEDWIPYFGIGGRVDFGQSDDCGGSNVSSTVTATNSSGMNVGCNNCANCSVSTWGIWIQGGLSFN
jgi:hypothetical protein